MNGFVDYLNSMHAVGGDALGALAEKQVQSPYSRRCHVSRRIGEYLVDRIRSKEPMAYIITGHAGDGKTSILVQVLLAYGMLKDGELLSTEKTCASSGTLLYYVKDMSEITAERRAVLLRDALTAPLSGKSSILISNTGPLLESFRDLFRADCEGRGSAYTSAQEVADQTELINQLDTNKEGVRTIGGYEFIMVNIARVDNVPFARAFLQRILVEDLWSNCAACSSAADCPIKNNRDTVQAQFSRVADFVESYYRYLYESDERLTIRQIQAHLCYSITGGLDCGKVNKRKVAPLFRYNFANLFFGYLGCEANPEALRMKAIRQLHSLNLDARSLHEDYGLFVKQRFDAFPGSVRTVLEESIYREYQKLNRALPSTEQKSGTGVEIRKAVRRFFLMYSNDDPSVSGGFAELLDQVFGLGYSDYRRLTENAGLRDAEKRTVRDTIFDALYLANTGFLPDGETKLPLTLHRDDGTFQSVMLVLGDVDKSKLGIVQQPNDNAFEDAAGRQAVYLRIAGDCVFPLSLPLLMFFSSKKNGAISSSCNPALTHNIAKLDTMLINHYGNSDGAEMKLVVNTMMGQKYQILFFDDDMIRLN